MGSFRVLGVGVGTFILAICWTFAILMCIFFSKAKGNITAAVGSIISASLFTSVLILLQRRDSPFFPTQTELDFTDPLFIGRAVLLIVLAISSLLCIGITLNSKLEVQRAFKVPPSVQPGNPHKIYRAQSNFTNKKTL